MAPDHGIHFNHAIRFREDMCIGCSHCMMVCPTEAIRVALGKAQLIPNRCIDCGECFRVCPASAIIVEQDDFENIYQYRYRVALVPAIFSGQFPDSARSDTVIGAIRELGFTHVYEVEEGVSFLVDHFNQYFNNQPSPRPLISPFCPAVVRLIQTRFPTLTKHIIRLKAPLDVTALRIRYELAQGGAAPGETGIFYVTPCAAKIVAIKNPVGEDRSAIDGVINMNYLYNKVFRILRQKKDFTGHPGSRKLNADAICWSLTRGEADLINVNRSLAIDQIDNVIEFLEKLENEEIDGIDFLELRACDESCAGGILCPGNRFLTVERLRKRSVEQNNDAETGNSGDLIVPGHLTEWLSTQVKLGEIHPRSILKLDDTVAGAMVKMKRIYELNQLLPKVDCGICGSPSCKSFSEDIVQGYANITQCIFIQKILEQNDKLDTVESTVIMRKIWGEYKLDKNGLKAELTELQERDTQKPETDIKKS